MKKSRSTKKASLTAVSECLYRNSRTDIYYAIVKRGKRQFKKSLKTNDRQLAERLCRDYRSQVKGLNMLMAVGKVTFSEISERWFAANKLRLKLSSAARLQTSINQLTPFFGPLAVRSITSTTCTQWEIQRGNGIAASTFNQERGALHRVFQYAISEGLLFENPASAIRRRKMSKGKIIIPTKDEFCLLVKTIRSADCRAWSAADLVELLAYSGMRLAEATALTWADVDFQRNSFVVTGGEKGTKNRESRTVPLFPAMRSLLEGLKARGLCSRDENVVPIQSARQALTTACHKANLPYFYHHTLRHHFVSNAIELGIDFKTIANWVRHKDGGLLVAKTYGHLRDTHSLDMAKRMVFSASFETITPAQDAKIAA